MRRFRPCTLDQPLLLAPSLHDWLRDDHLARFIAEVVGELDLKPILAVYQRKDNRGAEGYHPEICCSTATPAASPVRAASRTQITTSSRSATSPPTSTPILLAFWARHHRQLPSATSRSACRAVCPSAAVVCEGGTGEAAQIEHRLWWRVLPAVQLEDTDGTDAELANGGRWSFIPTDSHSTSQGRDEHCDTEAATAALSASR